MLYLPGNIPSKEHSIRETWEEFARISDALRLLENDGVHFNPLGVAPSKDIHALTVYAQAGVLGIFEGLYRYDSSESWIFVGNIVNQWDDLPPIPLINQDRGVANKPTLTTFRGSISQLTFDVGDDIDGSQELVHSYQEGTDIYPHVHMVTNGLEGSDKTVKWQLEYSVSNASFSPEFTYTFPTSTVITGEVTIPASTPDRSNVIIPLSPYISGTLIDIQAYIAYNFSRVASSGTEPASDPFALAIGFHIKQDSSGSQTEGSK
jgi:hypothetical protein